MDKFEDTVVNPNITLKNFEVRVRDADDIPKQAKVTTATQYQKKDKNYQKSIFLLVLLGAILVYQLSIYF